MAQSHLSLRLTDSYRARLLALSDRVERQARQSWPRIEELDATEWVDAMASTVNRAQVEGVRLTAGYLGAFLRTETGRGRIPVIAARDYAGISRDGRSLREALESPLIGVKARLSDGATPAEALSYGLRRAVRMVGFEAAQTPRDALLDAIEADDRFEGHERAVAGTCAACMALSGTSGPNFEIHPGCQCIPAPVVSGVTDRFPLPTGAALFASKTREEQDVAVGAEAAERVRSGDIELSDLVAHSHLAEQPDFVTQKPLDAVSGH